MGQTLREERRPRRARPRSRKGTLTCRARHTRCDEGRPICGNCRKSRLQCQQPGFVLSRWSALASLVVGTESSKMTQGNLQGTENYHLVVTKNEARAGTGVSPERSPDDQDSRTNLTCASESQQGLETFLSGNDRVAANNEVAPHAEPIITADIVHLRVYEKGIATWMDVFDSDLTYQRHLLYLAPSSPLLLNTICALSARQLSLIVSPITWKPVAEHYYGQAVHLLAHLLSGYPTNMELAIIGTILLASYELLVFPGLDYQRHFKGACTIINSLHAHKSASRLVRVSFWIYARHETETAEDSFCNHVLRLTGEIVCIVFGKPSGSGGKRRKRALSALHDELGDWFRLCPDRWKGTRYEEDGNARYWFPRPTFGTFSITYVCCCCGMNVTRVQEGSENGNKVMDQVDAHAKQMILIALSNLPDSAVVVVVQPLCYAVKHVRDNTLKENAILLLDDIETRTGFHTKSKLERQLSIDCISGDSHHRLV
ncbi:hypothetical protein BDW62DRAFT_213532 [Aspergillus aurantiobrunneus]